MVFVGNFVIARSSDSGVWFGRCDAIEGAADKLTVVLSEARRVHYWEGAGSCSGLAAYGPRGGRIAAPVSCVVAGVCEVLLATDAAIAQFGRLPIWNG